MACSIPSNSQSPIESLQNQECQNKVLGSPHPAHLGVSTAQLLEDPSKILELLLGIPEAEREAGSTAGEPSQDLHSASKPFYWSPYSALNDYQSSQKFALKRMLTNMIDGASLPEPSHELLRTPVFLRPKANQEEKFSFEYLTPSPISVSDRSIALEGCEPEDFGFQFLDSLYSEEKTVPPEHVETAIDPPNDSHEVGNGTARLSEKNTGETTETGLSPKVSHSGLTLEHIDEDGKLDENAQFDGVDESESDFVSSIPTTVSPGMGTTQSSKKQVGFDGSLGARVLESTDRNQVNDGNRKSYGKDNVSVTTCNAGQLNPFRAAKVSCNHSYGEDDEPNESSYDDFISSSPPSHAKSKRKYSTVSRKHSYGDDSDDFEDFDEADDSADDIDVYPALKRTKTAKKAATVSTTSSSFFSPPKAAGEKSRHPNAGKVRNGPFSNLEHDQIFFQVRARRTYEDANLDTPKLRDQPFWEYILSRLHERGQCLSRGTFGSLKNYWNRVGRARSGFEERLNGSKNGSLIASSQKAKGKAIRAKSAVSGIPMKMLSE